MSANSGIVSKLGITSATNPFIQNIVCTLSATEYSFTLPISTKGFIIGPRPGMGGLQLAYVAGTSNTDFVTLSNSTIRFIGDINLTSAITLYFQAINAGTIVEIEYWI